MDLDVLVANLDRVVVAALDLVVDVQLCNRQPLAFIRSTRCPSTTIDVLPVFPTQGTLHTPLGILVSILTGSLHDIVAQNARNLDGLVDLHAGVDTDPAVLIKVPAGLCTGGQEDTGVV